MGTKFAMFLGYSFDEEYVHIQCYVYTSISADGVGYSLYTRSLFTVQDAPNRFKKSRLLPDRRSVDRYAKSAEFLFEKAVDL